MLFNFNSGNPPCVNFWVHPKRMRGKSEWDGGEGGEFDQEIKTLFHPESFLFCGTRPDFSASSSHLKTFDESHLF